MLRFSPLGPPPTPGRSPGLSTCGVSDTFLGVAHQVWCWGDGTLGRSGSLVVEDGDRTAHSATPHQSNYPPTHDNICYLLCAYSVPGPVPSALSNSASQGPLVYSLCTGTKRITERSTTQVYTASKTVDLGFQLKESDFRVCNPILCTVTTHHLPIY